MELRAFAELGVTTLSLPNNARISTGIRFAKVHRCQRAKPLPAVRC